MFVDAFHKCTADDAARLLAFLDRTQPDHGFRQAGLVVLKKPLSFYPHATYFDGTQADQHPSRSVQVVMGPKQGLILNGRADDVLVFNQTYPLQLDRHLAIDYARFYFAHVTGPHGLSVIIDTVEDLSLREEPTPALRKSIGDKIIPLSLQASLNNGGYQLRCTLLIKQTLYNVVLDIDMAGQVSAQVGRVIAELLPVVDRVLEG